MAIESESVSGVSFLASCPFSSELQMNENPQYRLENEGNSPQMEDYKDYSSNANEELNQLQLGLGNKLDRVKIYRQIRHLQFI